MKKLFAFVATMGVLTFGLTQAVIAQDETSPAETSVAQDEAVGQAAVNAAENVEFEAEGGIHKNLKTKFIEGNAAFMSLVAITSSTT